MKLQRMDNVSIVVEDLPAAIAFFAAIGMEVEGRTTVEGRWVDRVIGLENVRADVAMMSTPDGHGRIELTRFHRPAAIRAERENAPANSLGLRRIMFAVEDVDAMVADLRTYGGELVGEVMAYENVYRLCYVRGPEGILVGLAEEIG